MSKILKVILVFVASFILVGVAGLIYLTRGIGDGLAIEVNQIDTSECEDGLYVGSFEFQRWSTTLEVEIKNEKIVSIEIIDDVTFVKEGVSKELFQKVVNQQRIPEDLVSEATITSKAYLKAIENAIKGTK